jgi:hypothetical protein
MNTWCLCGGGKTARVNCNRYVISLQRLNSSFIRVNCRTAGGSPKGADQRSFVTVQLGQSLGNGSTFRIVLNNALDGLVEGDQQRYIAGDNLGQKSARGTYLLFSALAPINPARMSCRIARSSGVNAPLARGWVTPARPCLKAFWFAGGPDLPRIPAMGIA